MRLGTTYSKALHCNTGASSGALLSLMAVVARRFVGGQRGKQSGTQEQAKVYRCQFGTPVAIAGLTRLSCRTSHVHHRASELHTYHGDCAKDLELLAAVIAIHLVDINR